MGVSKSAAASQPSQRKQQSISSFFSAKLASAPPKPTPPPKPTLPPTTQSPAPLDARSHSLFVSEDDAADEDETVATTGTKSIQKRGWGFSNGDVLNETTANGIQPPSPKRRKLSETTHATDANDWPSRSVKVPAPLERQGTSSRVTDRTSKYLFSPVSGILGVSPDISEDDEETVQRKETLHRKFVERLGDPQTLSQIKRRNGFIEDAVPDDDEDVDDEDDEDEPSLGAATKGRKTMTGKEKKMTPMESQVIDIKLKNMDTLLVVEVGYKYRFFGEDARTAAKELSIVCIPGEMRFDKPRRDWYRGKLASASIPVHRLHVHVKRLIGAGHKVGVVRQLETAALKAAGDNRNTPFVRQLTNLYTKGTYIDDTEGLETDVAGPSGGAPASGHLLCVTETNAKGWGTDEKVHFGIVAVQPGTGDIIYDDFEDGFMRTEIETRLLHIAPCEFLIVGNMSKASEKLVKHLSGSKTNVFGDKARVERVDKAKTASALSYSHISNFYAEKLKNASGTEEVTTGKILDKVHKLSEHVSICLSAMINHLTSYGLQNVFNLTRNFQPFSARSYMLLNGNTLNSLEIYRNQTDNTEKGSLFWVLDQTQTKFGQRLLRKWVGRPLLDQARLQERVDAIEELNDVNKATHTDKLRKLLVKTKSDLEKSLIRIYYGKATRPEVLGVLQTLQRISSEYAHVKSSSNSGFQSELLADAIAALPLILDDVLSELERINPEAAKADDKEAFFRDEHSTDDINNHKAGIAVVEQELDEHRADAASKLKKKRVDYVTVAGIEYLIEVENDKTNLKNVPASWQKQSGTKKFSRFHTPQVTRLIRERAQYKEALAAACGAAFQTLLASISSGYQTFRNAIHSLATLDCLLSLAAVATRPGYCKPTFTATTELTVEGGRHPMIEQLLLNAYVPNDTSLSHDTTSALLITGPNMGGKSSYVRQVALLSIMGQIGSYVPATSARLGLLDAVYTRMGAFDNMLAGESTFMVELSETADILKQATSRSLVILDELGRGTSTHDGVAIAQAVLDYLVRERKGLLLFITHYQSLGAVAAAYEDGRLRNVHMRFTEEAQAQSHDGEGGPDITFLYEIGEGMAHRSYGLNVARLAKLPREIIDMAAGKSRELEADVKTAKIGSAMGLMRRVFGKDAEHGVAEVEALVAAVEQL